MENIKYPIAIPLIDSLERIALWLEKQLGQKAIHFNELMKIPHYAECKNILRKHEAIIEMMYLDLGSKLKQNRIAYAAMIATAENPSPLFIRLCTEEELQTLFVSTSRLNVDYVNTLYSMNSRGMKSLDQNSNGLYELIWKKIESQLSDVHTIYYTPAGLLNKINIQAIPLSENTVVGELYNIIQFTSSKQLLNFNEQNNSLQSALIMGGIQYDKNEVNTNDQEQHKTHARGIVHPNNRSTDNFWPLLQNTLREIHQVNEIFQENNIKTSQYTGLNASEESFKREIKNGNSPGIIHIATHGYYFNKLDKDLKSLDFSTSCSFITSVNPMMRSGLVLANGNYGWKNSKPLPGHEEDGILTALEISQMNLSHTQLAVLSACETGLGEIRGNEGVFGLQRAFKIAGVKYLIMSLWEVPDYQTEELMSHFYYNLLNQKMELPVAFQNAQLELKHKYNNPYFWAGFIMVQ
jgi:CHAT domain-containing protein